jgi:multiple sugar transport system permease protein
MKPSLSKRIILYGLALLAALYLVVPFLWVALTSFKPEREVSQLHWIPQEPTLENYALYFDTDNRSAAVGAAIARQFPRAIANSLIIGLAVALINLFFGSLAAYALARVDFKGSLLLMLFYLGSRSVPGVAIMIPMYLVIRSYGLLDTHLAVILAHSTFTLPFSVWILKGYFQTVPLELELAARVDGCSRLGALFRIFLPVTTPALAAVGIFAFIASWGEFLFALLFTSTLHAKTATVLASDFAQETQVPFSLIAAGGVLVILLPIALAFLFQRFIIHGISGSVKG